jgi:hypothetical protein
LPVRQKREKLPDGDTEEPNKTTRTWVLHSTVDRVDKLAALAWQTARAIAAQKRALSWMQTGSDRRAAKATRMTLNRNGLYSDSAISSSVRAGIVVCLW